MKEFVYEECAEVGKVGGGGRRRLVRWWWWWKGKVRCMVCGDFKGGR